MKKLIIDRGEWLRGQRESCLLNARGKRCCLGILGREIGYTDKELLWRRTPGETEQYREKWPEWLFMTREVSLLNVDILMNLRGIRGERPVILVIEDADDCLVPRGPDNMTAISTLLNFADGIIGTMLDIRIIATSNAKKPQMDSALLRPGRLCRQVEIGKLSIEQSGQVYKRLSGGKEMNFDKPKTLAEIYEVVYGNAEKAKEEKSILGFTNGNGKSNENHT